MIEIHPTAEVSKDSVIGEGTKIWHQAHVREHCKIGTNCIIGKGAYIDIGVVIGNNVKIQNYSCVYNGTTIEDGVFIGPGVLLINDKLPRSVSLEGKLLRKDDWKAGKTLVKKNASIGAGAVVLPEITIGEYAMVGAGAVVTKNVPDHGLVIGNPGVLKGTVCKCGKMSETKECEVCK